jgi:hypothetical protein
MTRITWNVFTGAAEGKDGITDRRNSNTCGRRKSPACAVIPIDQSTPGTAPVYQDNIFDLFIISSDVNSGTVVK